MENQANHEIKSLEQHHYYLFHQDFNNESTSNAIKFILERNLMFEKPKNMKIIFNSSGGELPAAFALIDIMTSSKIPIYTYGLGEIASCGLYSFTSGTRGKRYITKNTSILSHQFSWYTTGKEHELMATSKEVELASKRLLNHYKKCTGMSEEEIKKYLLPPHDVWLTPKEAVKHGIADEIIEIL
jgi:ATP-dependent Clp endopeptidase proteolytic subunit ClpP